MLFAGYFHTRQNMPCTYDLLSILCGLSLQRMIINCRSSCLSHSRPNLDEADTGRF